MCHGPRGRPGAYPPALQDVGEAILTKPGWPKEAPAGCLLRMRRDVGTIHEVPEDLTTPTGGYLESYGVAQTGHSGAPRSLTRAASCLLEWGNPKRLREARRD